MSDVYHSTDYGMSIVHVYGHQNSGKLDSNLTSVAYLNVQLYAKSEVIMASLLSFPASRTTIAVRLAYSYG